MRAIDRCAQTNRWRHLAAGEKLLIALGTMLISLSATGWAGQMFLFAMMIVFMVAGARIRTRDIFSAARVPLLFIAAGTLAQLLSVSMNDYWPQVSLVDNAAIEKVGFVAMRSIACVSALLFLALTTPLTSLVQLAQRQGISPELCDVALVMFRMIWSLLDALEAGRQALSARLGHAGYRRTIRSNGLLLAALLPRVLGRAQRMERGLAARGYQGRLAFLSRERPASFVRLSLGSFALFCVFGLTWWLG